MEICVLHFSQRSHRTTTSMVESSWRKMQLLSISSNRNSPYGTERKSTFFDVTNAHSLSQAISVLDESKFFETREENESPTSVRSKSRCRIVSRKLTS
mmetsp:Transcript_10286/g.30124  ORF Transcript_10286/g.30124 Transcript_10286/m.30124 type:complete len:98 (+) Transcript_10286:116-409(+)